MLKDIVRSRIPEDENQGVCTKFGILVDDLVSPGKRHLSVIPKVFGIKNALVLRSTLFF